MVAGVPDVTRRTAGICDWPYPVGSDQVLLVVMPGDPIPASRPGWRKGRAYTNRRYGRYRDALADLMRDAAVWQRDGVDGLGGGEYGIRALFFRGTRRRVDVDNLLKTCMDAGTGVVWRDDSQVVEAFGRVFRGSPEPRVVVLVYRVETPDLRPARRCGRCGRLFYPRRPAGGARFCSRGCVGPAAPAPGLDV
ncbi:MAG: RusA family crossover junction endodeoxyribonuclease [Armatimonadota bacterium]|nr:RusA family crossover junction endodeoxyribonuclease [Armatimonadota bacterium]